MTRILTTMGVVTSGRRVVLAHDLVHGEAPPVWHPAGGPPVDAAVAAAGRAVGLRLCQSLRRADGPGGRIPLARPAPPPAGGWRQPAGMARPVRASGDAGGAPLPPPLPPLRWRPGEWAVRSTTATRAPPCCQESTRIPASGVPARGWSRPKRRLWSGRRRRLSPARGVRRGVVRGAGGEGGGTARCRRPAACPRGWGRWWRRRRPHLWMVVASWRVATRLRRLLSRLEGLPRGKGGGA